MEARRSRLGFASFVEWLIAAGVIGVVLVAGSLIVREIRTVRAVTPVLAGPAAMEPPPGVPPRAVSVPMVVLADGKQLHVGARLSDVAAVLGQAAQVGADAIERAAGRQRLTRFYDYIGSRFAVVFEPSDPASEPQVVAIYLQ
jgi:hypothetical protein